MAHTPGPWKVDKSGFNVIRSTAPITIAMTQPSTHMKDDARLISAAPDLLEVLKRIMQDSDRLTESEFQQAATAIAKATGGAS